jgi:hypothetical protein
MKKDELINIWKEGDDLMFRDEKTDKKMITQYLNEKTLKGSRSINFNIIFYGFIQIANLILLSLNLAGYMSNPSVVWILIPQLVVTIGILIYGMDLFYKLREINNYSESLLSLIQKQLRFFKKPYEIWLILSSISAIILISNVNLYIDNDNGTYTINNKMLFIGVTLAAFLFIYGSQKVSSLRSLRSLKAYLYDLQKGVLDQSEQLERSKKKLVWFYVAVFILLTAAMVLGLLKARQFMP